MIKEIIMLQCCHPHIADCTKCNYKKCHYWKDNNKRKRILDETWKPYIERLNNNVKSI